MNFGYCYEYKWKTIASSEYNCIHKRNITFFGFESAYSSLPGEIQNFLGICFTVNVFSPSTRKTVPINSKDYMPLELYKNYKNYQSTLNNLQILSGEIYKNQLDGTKQTLVFFSTVHRSDKFNKLIFQEIRNIKKKGWDNVIICMINGVFPTCPIEEWIPKHMIFSIENGFKTNYDDLGHVFSTLLYVLRNPMYDRADWLMKIELFNKSCFSGPQIVFHISISSHKSIFLPLLPLLKNAMIVISRFSSQRINFQFDFASSSMLPFYDTKFIKFFLKKYKVDNKAISFSHRFEFRELTIFEMFKKNMTIDDVIDLKILFRRFEDKFNLDAIIDTMKTIEIEDPKKKNILLSSMIDFDITQEEICSNVKYSKSDMKNIHFFTSMENQHSSLPCQNKFVNIHNGVDLYNEEHFFETINKIACDME